MRFIFCAEHGNAEWQGHVVCAQDAGGCGRVFQTKDSAAPLYASVKCVCGKQLMPAGSSRQDFTARAVCAHCFDERKAGPS